MPTYDYRCDQCKHEMELFQSMKAKPLRKCPECGRNALKRLIGTGAGVLFKGSGFWQTDYRSEGYKKAAEAEKKSAEPKTDTTAKSDKPATTKAEKTPTQKPKKAPATKKNAGE